MTNQNTYVHGSWNMISDRSGFKHKRGDMRKEWDGSWVHKDDFDPRHPQDRVKGVPDDQSVADPRPGATDTYSETSTTLDAEELAGQTVLSVASTASMTVGDSVILFMDNDQTHLSTIASFVANDTVTINDATTYKAASGSTLVVYSNTTAEADL